MYNNGKIYSIRSPHTEYIYIGSTIQSLSKRFSGHKGSYSSFIKKGVAQYCKCFDILKLGDAYIELIENFSCDTKEQLLKKEGETIRQYKDICVNKIINGRTIKEYREEHKDHIKDLHKKYREEHKDKIKKYREKYHNDNKDILKQKRKDKHYKINDEKKQKNDEYKQTEEYKQVIAERRKIKTERDKIRISKLSLEEKEIRRLRHNELQQIRRMKANIND
jgi:hypothetical protein